MYFPAEFSRTLATTKEAKLSHLWQPLDPTPDSSLIVEELSSRTDHISSHLHESWICSSSLVKPNDALTGRKLFRVTLPERREIAKEPRRCVPVAIEIPRRATAGLMHFQAELRDKGSKYNKSVKIWLKAVVEQKDYLIQQVAISRPEWWRLGSAYSSAVISVTYDADGLWTAHGSSASSAFLIQTGPLTARAPRAAAPIAAATVAAATARITAAIADTSSSIASIDGQFVLLFFLLLDFKHGVQSIAGAPKSDHNNDKSHTGEGNESSEVSKKPQFHVYTLKQE